MPAKSEEWVAIDTLKLLIKTPIVDFDENKINRLVAVENDFLPNLTLPNFTTPATEKMCAQLEAALHDFLPALPAIRVSLHESEYGRRLEGARAIAQAIDQKLSAATNYWSTLLAFLETADIDTWTRWRRAAFAQKQAQQALRDGAFAHAKKSAIWGLQQLQDIPDRRLYLRLAARLQCSLAEGDGADGVAEPLGAWIVSEAENLGFYLLATSMAYNLGNQHIISGNAGTSTRWLEKAQKLSKRWKYIKHMDWYSVAVLERLAVVMQRTKDYEKMKALLEEYHRAGSESRVAILYHKGMAAYYEYTGDLVHAEKQIKIARDLAMQKKPDGQYVDCYNAWASQVTLACIYTLSDKHTAKEAIAALEQARAFSKNLHGFLNEKRQCSDHIFTARAWMKAGDLQKVKEQLGHADRLLQKIDAPRHAVRKWLLEAKHGLATNDRTAAQHCLAQAKTMSSKHSIVDYDEEIDAIHNSLA